MIEYLLIGLLIGILILFVYYYNRIAVLSNRIDNAWSQIDVQLQKRADLVPNLVKVVEAYMKHEQKVLIKVTEARSALLKASSVEERARAGNMLEDALKSLFAVAENYPDLKASQNFLSLQEELSDIENKIAYTRQFYNDSVLHYNNLVTTIPGIWFASLINKKQKPYLEVPKEKKEAPKVEFDV